MDNKSQTKTLRVSNRSDAGDGSSRPNLSKYNAGEKTLRVFWPALAAALLFLIYLAIVWFYLSPSSLWSPDEGAKLLQTKSLRWQDGRLAFDIQYAGAAIDPNLVYALSNPVKDLLRVVDGRLMLERLPIFSLATLPFYRQMGMFGLHVLPALGGALAALLTLLLLDKPKHRWPAFLLVAFGSPVFIYALLFWEHTLASSLALAGAAFMLRLGEHKSSRPGRNLATLLPAVLLLSSAVYLRQEILVFAAALLAAGWVLFRTQRRWILLAGILLVLTLLPFQPLHKTLFAGQELPLNARYINLPLGYLRTAQWAAVPDLLVGPAEDEGAETGWLGGLWAISAIIAVGHSFSRDTSKPARILERAGLLVSAGVALYFLFSPLSYRSAHGLLFSTPWAVLGFTRAAEVWRTRDQKARVLILTCALGLGAYTLMMVGVRASSPQGGLEWGARFFMTFYPLLAILAAWGWSNRETIDRVIIGALILTGFGFQMRGLITIRQDKQIHAQLNQAIQATPEQHLITDLWWLLLVVAPDHPDKALYAAAGPAEMADWVDQAAGQGVVDFNLVTLDHNTPIQLAAEIRHQSLAIREVLQVDNLLIYRLVLE